MAYYFAGRESLACFLTPGFIWVVSLLPLMEELLLEVEFVLLVASAGVLSVPVLLLESAVPVVLLTFPWQAVIQAATAIRPTKNSFFIVTVLPLNNLEQGKV